MNDRANELTAAVASALFFVLDNTRKCPDIIAVQDMTSDRDMVKGVIVKTSRAEDLGAWWWTTKDDLQTGLEMGYFDVTKSVTLNARRPA